jgi:hypothetical protein
MGEIALRLGPHIDPLPMRYVVNYVTSRVNDHYNAVVMIYLRHIAMGTCMCIYTFKTQHYHRISVILKGVIVWLNSNTARPVTPYLYTTFCFLPKA